MASWNDLLKQFDALPDDSARTAWLNATLTTALNDVSTSRGGNNVVLYASAFLQKPGAPGNLIQLTAEDINGFMSVIYGMDFTKGLTLLLHTPGGVTNATETVVDYLRRKFKKIEAIVPTLAMSAGTMIALACDRIVMGKHSQLGPIDPQLHMPSSGRFVSARAIVDQFEKARADIIGDVITAHAWAPVLQSLGGGLLQEAQNALDYGESMVSDWLETYMFKKRRHKNALATQAAQHFNDANIHKSHGRRIDRDEARAQKIRVEDLEDDQTLQDRVLTAYHLATIVFEKSPTSKFMHSNAGRAWVKNWTS